MKKLFLTLLFILFSLLVFADTEPVLDMAVNIGIEDSGGYYTGDEVESALQEIGDGTTLDGKYLKLDGSNANTDIDIGVYGLTLQDITFVGDGLNNFSITPVGTGSNNAWDIVPGAASARILSFKDWSSIYFGTSDNRGNGLYAYLNVTGAGFNLFNTGTAGYGFSADIAGTNDTDKLLSLSRATVPKFYVEATGNTYSVATIQAEQLTSTDDIQASGKIRTILDGTSDDNYISAGASDDLRLHHNGSNSYINTVTGDLYITAAGGDVLFDNENLTTTGAGNFKNLVITPLVTGDGIYSSYSLPITSGSMLLNLKSTLTGTTAMAFFDDYRGIYGSITDSRIATGGFGMNASALNFALNHNSTNVSTGYNGFATYTPVNESATYKGTGAKTLSLYNNYAPAALAPIFNSANLAATYNFAGWWLGLGWNPTVTAVSSLTPKLYGVKLEKYGTFTTTGTPTYYAFHNNIDDASVNWNIYNESIADNYMGEDNSKTCFGSAGEADSYIEWDGSYLNMYSAGYIYLNALSTQIANELDIAMSGGGAFRLYTNIAGDLILTDSNWDNVFTYEQASKVEWNVSQVIDTTSTEALLLRKDSDGGDLFLVDTYNGKVKLPLDGSSSSNYFSVGAGDDLKVYYTGSGGVFNNVDVTTSDSTGKLQFYGNLTPTASPSSTNANTFNGTIDLRNCSPASNADFIGNNFVATYQSNDTTAGFPAISFVGTNFLNTINLNSSGSPRFQTGSFTAVKYTNNFTGAYSTVAGFNAIPIVIANSFTASVTASHQMIGLGLTSDYNANNSVNQNRALSAFAAQSQGTLGGSLTGIYGGIGTTSGAATLSSDAKAIVAYIGNAGTAFNTNLAAGKRLMGFATDFSGYTAMASHDTYGYYCDLANAATVFSFVSDGADGWMNTDIGGWYFGAGKDLFVNHNGTNSRIINITGELILGSPTTFTLGTGAAGVDYILKFDGESNDGLITWSEDEDYFKFSDDILINSTEKIYFNDTNSYIYDNGTNLILATNGAVHTEQAIEALAYSAGGNAGISTTKVFTDADSNEHTVVVTGGIITSWSVATP